MYGDLIYIYEGRKTILITEWGDLTEAILLWFLPVWEAQISKIAFPWSYSVERVKKKLILINSRKPQECLFPRRNNKYHSQKFDATWWTRSICADVSFTLCNVSHCHGDRVGVSIKRRPRPNAYRTINVRYLPAKIQADVHDSSLNCQFGSLERHTLILAGIWRHTWTTVNACKRSSRFAIYHEVCARNIQVMIYKPARQES